MYQRPKLYVPSFTYRPTKEDLVEVQLFAEKVAPTTLEEYRRRGQPYLTMPENIQNHRAAALSEIAYYLYMISKGFDMTKPDFTLHVRKSFNADLRAKHPKAPNREFKIHVKTQLFEKVNGTRRTPSYSFEPYDKLVKNPTEDDLIGMSVNNGDSIDIVRVLPAINIFPKFKDMQVNMNPDKVAIYWRDIKNSIDAGTFYV